MKRELKLSNKANQDLYSILTAMTIFQEQLGLLGLW